MALMLDVVNRALGYNGLEQINSLDDASPTAEAVKTQWRACMESFLHEDAWSFAKREVAPARADYQPRTWLYAYSIPDDFVRKIALLYPQKGRYPGRRTPHYPGVPHEIMRVEKQRRPFICTDADEIVLQYVSDRTLLEDFPPPAVDSLEYLLAAKLCLTLKNSSGNTRTLMELYAYHLDKAKDAELSAHNTEFLDNSGYDDARETYFLGN